MGGLRPNYLFEKNLLKIAKNSFWGEKRHFWQTKLGNIGVKGLGSEGGGYPLTDIFHDMKPSLQDAGGIYTSPLQCIGGTYN